MKIEDYKYPRKFMELECKDEFGEVVGYTPVSCLLFSEIKEYYYWGTSNQKYIVSSEVLYNSILQECVKNDDCLNTKCEVFEIFDNYEECKQACIKENERILSNKKKDAGVRARAYNLESEQITRCIENTQKRCTEIQNKLFESTDKLYEEKSKSLDGSKAKQVVQKVKSNNKENQGK